VPRCTVYFFLIAQIAIVFIRHRPALAGINLVNAISLVAIVAPLPILPIFARNDAFTPPRAGESMTASASGFEKSGLSNKV